MNRSFARGRRSAPTRPAPVRSWNWPGCGGAPRPGRGRPSASAAPVRSAAIVVEVEADVAARRAMSAARSRDPGDVAAVGAFVVIVPAHDAARAGEVGRQLVGCGRAARRARRGWRRSTQARPVGLGCGDHHRARRGCTGRASIRPSGGGRSTVGVERAEAPQQLLGLLQRPGRRWIDEAQLARPAFPTRPAPARGRRGRPG